MNDLKFAFRQLLKNPGFTAVAAKAAVIRCGEAPRRREFGADNPRMWIA